VSDLVGCPIADGLPT